MDRLSIIVRATWDDEASVWVADSSDVPGLVTEAATFEALRDQIFSMIPELLELNGVTSHLLEIPVHIVAQQLARVPNPSMA